MLGNPGATNRDSAMSSGERYFQLGESFFKSGRASGNLFLPTGNSVAFLHEVVFFINQPSCLARTTGKWSHGEFQKKKIQRSRNKLLESNTLISIFSADLSKVYHKLLKLMHAISTLLRCKRIFERSILIVASRISNSLSKTQNLAHVQKRDCVP